MKKNIFRTLSLVLVLCMALTACGKSENPAEGSGKDRPALSDAADRRTHPTKAPETTEAARSQSYGDHLLDSLQYEGTYNFGGDSGDGCDFIYDIPQILDDTPEARELNESLKKICQDAVDEVALNYSKISWESHWNDSLLSLVIEFWPPYTSDVMYFTYNYDFELGASIPNLDLFERLDTNWLEMDNAIRRAAAARFDSDSLSIYEAYSDSFSQLAELRAQTLSYLNLDPGTMPIYLDDEGRPHCFVLIGTPAGGGCYAQDLLIDLTPAETVQKEAVCDFVTAELKDNQVNLSFHKTDMGEAFLPIGFSDYDLLYMVEGLYGEYTDLTVGFLGNGGYLFLLLADTNGQVTFCNITNGFNCGMQFYAVGPLELPEDIVSFTVSSDSGGSTIHGHTASGGDILMDPYILEAEATMPSFLADTTWYAEDVNYSFNISSEGSLNTWCGGGGVLATGYSLPYLGTTDSGMHFMMQMITEEGEFIGGLVTIVPSFDTSLPGMEQSLSIVQMFGSPLPGFAEGGFAQLYQAVG